MENFRGAILGSKKIWISIFLCCIFASRSQAAPQHNFRKRVFKFCIRFALTLHLLSEAASGAPQMKKQYSLFIHSAFFDILQPQKVRQVDLSETPGCVVGLSFATESLAELMYK